MVFWVNATTSGALISKFVPLVPDVLLEMLPGVLPLPGSSNSTVKGKAWEGGVMAAVISVAERVAVFSTSGDVQGVFTLLPVLRNPAGKAPELALMHHW